jgi:DUF971 family protein
VSELSVNRAEPEHIAISKSKGIKIDWRDQHCSEYSLHFLRDECPCATCTGAHGTEPQKSDYSSAATSGAKELFPMYKPTLKMLHVEQVGGYAIRIDWSDGHNTGIYSFDHLRAICPCTECKAAKALATKRHE